VVRLPRTARDVLRRLNAFPSIVQRGVRLASTAPALTIAERQHIERVLGAGRVALCVAALLSVRLDPAWRGSHGELATALLVGYAAFGAFAFAAAHAHRMWVLPPHVTHAIDFSIAAALTMATGGPASSPFVLFFLFVLLGAAYRWGVRETLLTTLAAVLALSAEHVFAAWGSARVFALDDVQLYRILTRSTYLIIAGVLIGVVAESELQRRAELAVIGSALSRLHAETSVHGAMRDTSNTLLALFGAERLVTVVHDPGSGASYAWTARTLPSGTDVRVREIGPEERTQIFFSAPGDAWETRRRRPGGVHVAAAFGHQGQWLGKRRCHIPDAVWSGSPATTLAGVEVSLAGQWPGRVFLMRDRPLGAADLAFFQELVLQLAPALFSVYLVRRLRARVSAAERARVARDLHDGIIQGLAGLRLEVAALRRHADRGLPVEAELMRLEHILGEQVIAARELMHRVRPVEVTPKQLPGYLGAIVERFTRETGIPTDYDTDVAHADLSPRTCRELARTLQEALVNVRKHSAARHVAVRFSGDPIHYRLTIDNDGRPFEFAGRHTLAELESARRGPVVIKERVREMGGELVIESSPERGVRLDILLRRRLRAGSSKTA
jgi:signal transduction histidine kinase